jgi:hypothetical protein
MAVIATSANAPTMSLVMGLTSCVLMLGQRERTIFVASVRQGGQRAGGTPQPIRRGDLFEKRLALVEAWAFCNSVVTTYSGRIKALSTLFSNDCLGTSPG